LFYFSGELSPYFYFKKNFWLPISYKGEETKGDFFILNFLKETVNYFFGAREGGRRGGCRHIYVYWLQF
jgi:hypothetical protein